MWPHAAAMLQLHTTEPKLLQITKYICNEKHSDFPRACPLSRVPASVKCLAQVQLKSERFLQIRITRQYFSAHFPDTLEVPRLRLTEISPAKRLMVTKKELNHKV